MDLIRIDVTNGGVSVGTFVNFVWVTIGENFFYDHISAKEEGKEEVWLMVWYLTCRYGYKKV